MRCKSRIDRWHFCTPKAHRCTGGVGSLAVGLAFTVLPSGFPHRSRCARRYRLHVPQRSLHQPECIGVFLNQTPPGIFTLLSKVYEEFCGGRHCCVHVTVRPILLQINNTIYTGYLVASPGRSKGIYMRRNHEIQRTVILKSPFGHSAPAWFCGVSAPSRAETQPSVVGPMHTARFNNSSLPSVPVDPHHVEETIFPRGLAPSA